MSVFLDILSVLENFVCFVFSLTLLLLKKMLYKVILVITAISEKYKVKKLFDR